MAGGLQEGLRDVADVLDRTGWAAELYDEHWRLVALSREWRLLLGDPPEDELGYGLHAVEVRALERWSAASTPASHRAWLRTNVARMAAATPGGLDAVLAMLSDADRGALGRVLPEPWQPAWAGRIEYVEPGREPGHAQYLAAAIAGPAGPLGWAIVYGPYAPATVTSLLMRGRLEHFARLATLQTPARHEAAVLFADMQASAVLSRRTSTAGWFEVVRAFTTDVDELVIANGGIVGRHAGDGVTAFFLADQLGSRGDACAAALRAALGMVRWRAPETLAAQPDVRINAAVHWGGALYLGQVVSGGRLEVTALGDEVNECARVQQTARDGTLLASKPLVERLWPEQAREFGLDPLTVAYRCVAEIPGVGEKAVRDAGGLAVVAVA